MRTSSPDCDQNMFAHMHKFRRRSICAGRYKSRAGCHADEEQRRTCTAVHTPVIVQACAVSACRSCHGLSYLKAYETQDAAIPG